MEIIQISYEVDNADQETIDLTVLESQSICDEYPEEIQNSKISLIHEDLNAIKYVDPFLGDVQRPKTSSNHLTTVGSSFDQNNTVHSSASVMEAFDQAHEVQTHL